MKCREMWLVVWLGQEGMQYCSVQRRRGKRSISIRGLRT